jgi:hypothetical protein
LGHWQAKASKNAIKTGEIQEVYALINYINYSNTLTGYCDNGKTSLGNKKY